LTDGEDSEDGEDRRFDPTVLSDLTVRLED